MQKTSLSEVVEINQVKPMAKTKKSKMSDANDLKYWKERFRANSVVINIYPIRRNVQREKDLREIQGENYFAKKCKDVSVNYIESLKSWKRLVTWRQSRLKKQLYLPKCVTGKGRLSSKESVVQRRTFYRSIISRTEAHPMFENIGHVE